MDRHVLEEQADHDWVAGNQAYLAAALAEVKAALSRHVDRGTSAGGEDAAPEIVPDERASGPAPLPGDPAAIETLCAAFNLSRFERSILLLCAGIELDSTVAPLCAAAQGNTQRSYPTFSLALAAFPGAHWSALTPSAPLRRWRLIEVSAGPALTVAQLRIDESVLHYLTGLSYMDDRLSSMVEWIAPMTPSRLVHSHASIVQDIVAAWSTPRSSQRLVAVQLCSSDPMECRVIAAAAAAAMHLRAAALPAELIPTPSSEMNALLRLWEREAVLGQAVLVIECEPETTPSDDARSSAAARFTERIDSLVIVCSDEPRRITLRPSIKFKVSRPTTSEQQAAWRAALRETADPDRVDTIATQFSMGLATIESVAIEVSARAHAAPGIDVIDAAWLACRSRRQVQLKGLAQRIEPVARWEDLVLPAPQMVLLRQIAIHVRHRATVYDAWGFRKKSSRGLGIAALFAGTSGTGKTMAAEVLAAELRLDLYRIDLSSVVSKYIGETEKNLRRVFDAAEQDGAILLFDEADALFGKRSEVKDSHDRYSNIEVSYLLQRMEAYRGLAILTTNMKSALDTAFLRRIRFVVQFPFPDAAQRAEIWRRIFPPTTPIEGVDVEQLARLNVPGGSIRNIAVNAAFLAAANGEPVRMNHLLLATRTEYAKLERPLSNAEISSWLSAQ